LVLDRRRLALQRTGTVTGLLPVIIKTAKRGIGGERRSMSRVSTPRIAGDACPGISARCRVACLADLEDRRR